MSDEGQVVSRADAKARGLNRYFTGEPCVRGHVCERLISCSHCVECARTRDMVRYRKNPTRGREHGRLHGKAFREKYRVRNDKIKDLLTVLRQEMPELLKEFGL